MPDVTILLIKQGVLCSFLQYNTMKTYRKIDCHQNHHQVNFYMNTEQVKSRKRGYATVKTTSSSVFYILNYKLF